MRRVVIAATALALNTPGLAHSTTTASGWNWAPGATVPLVVALALYFGGLWRLHYRRAGRAPFRGNITGRTLAFGLGWIALAVALLSPVDALGSQLFWVHMIQHEILMLLAAPLLVLGRPLPLFLWFFPAAVRDWLGMAIRSPAVTIVWNGLTRPVTAWALHALALWLWHAPTLFGAALQNPLVHDLQHLSFLATALLFWSGLLSVRSHSGAGAGILYLFTTAVHSSVLGALITLTDKAWYPAYTATAPAHGWLTLEDQQLGGLIMWIPGSMVYVVFALVLLSRWLRAQELHAAVASCVPQNRSREEPSPSI
jgi:putative membrane protein